MKNYHVLLIAALTTLGLSACDKGGSPEETKAPAASESTMSDSIEGAADDAINIIEETVDEASDSVDQIMDDMSSDAEDEISDAMRKLDK
ncbi:MAG: hypothetical protein P8Q91_02405 [Porticoccaceae bacterium]|nr:hypothetical protein [Porticoccaceae bacterium]